MEKAEMLAKVASSPLPKRKVLRELGIPKPESTEGGRRVSILKWSEGALLNLG